MTQIAFIGVGLLGLAALDGAAPDHLATVQELTGPGVVELFGGELLQLALLVQAVDHLGRHALVHAKRRLQAGSAVQVAGDLEVAQRLGLAIVIALDIIANRALELAGIDLLAIALHDGRAIAIRARDEHHVLAAQAVAEEAGVEVSRHEDAAHVPEVQALVAVGHARGHDGATRPGGTVGTGEMLCHGEDPFRMDAQVETTYKRPLSHSGPSSRVIQWDSPNVPLRPGRKPCRERRERRARAASTTLARGAIRVSRSSRTKPTTSGFSSFFETDSAPPAWSSARGASWTTTITCSSATSATNSQPSCRA